MIGQKAHVQSIQGPDDTRSIFNLAYVHAPTWQKTKTKL